MSVICFSCNGLFSCLPSVVKFHIPNLLGLVKCLIYEALLLWLLPMSAGLACICKFVKAEPRAPGIGSFVSPLVGLQVSGMGLPLTGVPTRLPGGVGIHCCPGVLASRAAQLVQPLRDSGADACQAGGLEGGGGPVCEGGH